MHCEGRGSEGVAGLTPPRNLSEPLLYPEAGENEQGDLLAQCGRKESFMGTEGLAGHNINAMHHPRLSCLSSSTKGESLGAEYCL